MLRKILSVIIAVVIIAVPLMSVFAHAESVQKYPLVYVNGFMSRELHSDKNNPDSDVIWPPSAESILKTAGKMAPYIAKFAVDKDWDYFAEKSFPYVGELFAPVCCTNDGTVTNGSGIIFDYPDKETVTYGGSYDFYYDWRLDPVDIADELNDFINYILECSGAEKVSIIAHSLGGVITLSYLTLYGTQKVDGVCFYVSAIYGEAYNGQLMSGKIGFNGDCLTEFMRGTFSDNEYQYLLASIFDVLNKTGILDPICACANYAIDQCLDVAAREAVLPLFANWLSIWSMVPDKYMNSAKEYVFDNVYSNVDRSVIIGKIDRYNNTVRAHKEETLKKLNETANVIVISGYGFTPIPIIPDWKVLSDTNVDTSSTSFGAITAPYGEQLSEEYLQSADSRYISPEKNIDASTCLFPEQTWFVENLKHTAGGGVVSEMQKTLLFSEKQPTVDTYEEYPRFLKYSAQENTLTPNTEAVPAPTFIQTVILVIKDIVKLIKNLINK